MKYLQLLVMVCTANLSVIAQCGSFVSPEPTCIRVLDNGDVEVDYDTISIGGANPGQIKKLDLMVSMNGVNWVVVNIEQIGSSWPSPTTMTHVGANAINSAVPSLYKFEAECISVPSNVPLPGSSEIQVVKLKAASNNYPDVDLAWNWDTLTKGNVICHVMRSIPHDSNNYVSVGTPIYDTASMSYTDMNVPVVKDMVRYQIVQMNFIKSCHTISTFVDIVIDKYATIEFFDDSEELVVFPNPSSGQVTITGLDPNAMVKLYSVDSKLLHSQIAHANQLVLDYSIFESGMYYLQIQSSEQTVSKVLILVD